MYDPYQQQYAQYGAPPVNYPPQQYGAPDPYGGYGAPQNYPSAASVPLGAYVQPSYAQDQTYPAAEYGAAPTNYPPMQQYSHQAAPACTTNSRLCIVDKLNSFQTPHQCQLIIGINYIKNPRAKLNGCINDANNLRYYLSTHGFDPSNIVVLTDDTTDMSKYPSRAVIMQQMRNLVAGAQPGDSLWFSFSGHGSQVADTSGDEADGMDETLCPADYTTAGQIVDDDIYDIMVKPLQPGVRMHAIMDCCHSGTGMDLPFMFDGTRITGDAPSAAAPQQAFNRKDKKKGKGQQRPMRPAQPPPQGLVVLFSGCLDTQTSADASGLASDRKIATGALTYVWLDTVNNNPNVSYSGILSKMRMTLKTKGFSQIPQLSFNSHFDLNAPMTL